MTEIPSLELRAISCIASGLVYSAATGSDLSYIETEFIVKPRDQVSSRALPSSLALLGVILLIMAPPAYSHVQEAPGTKDEDSPEYQTALFLLEASMDEVKVIQDINTRIDLTEQILRLLAGPRPDRCRAMLDLLFDDALNLRNSTATEAKSRQPDLRTTITRIIRIAAHFDRQLAQAYMSRYEESEAKLSAVEPRQPSEATVNLKLKVATVLIAEDPPLAIAIAKSSLTFSVTSQTLVFLRTLRKKDIVSANDFFAAALYSVKARRGYNINELLLLYSYVFSPKNVPYLTERGLSMLHIPDYVGDHKEYPIDAKVATQYLDTSLQILLEPSRYSSQGLASLGAGVMGDLYFINIIEPYVRAYLPTFTESVVEFKALISQYLHPDRLGDLRARLDRWNSLGDKAPADPILGTSSPVENRNKDRRYYSTALGLVKAKEYEKAMQLVEMMSPEYRRQAQELIQFTIAENAVKDSDTDKAGSIARRDGNLVRRAYILTLVAEVLSGETNTDLVRANEILTELGQIAAKLDHTAERFVVLCGAAAISSGFDKVRAFEFIREAIKVANKIDNFDGDPLISFSIELSDFGYFHPVYRDRFTFHAALQSMASADFNGLLFDVKGLSNPMARIKAIIAVCGPVLTKEKK